MNATLLLQNCYALSFVTLWNVTKDVGFLLPYGERIEYWLKVNVQVAVYWTVVAESRPDWRCRGWYGGNLEQQ